ncbi:sugar transferase [Roseicella aerolata]|uniref:Sugar transferase n=1 Tax=Roseicella aerolata TaxID=2883479 RepID=A0A9X1IA28_9PROT|nr:sugar transferase [Roseicella aerolata]MCB4820592.1 sugar transferase [Roseicella aerolata]
MYERWGKRAFDITGAVLLLLVTAPLLALAVLGVLCVLGRPVLFRQVRTGRDGAPFLLLKLRSLREGPGDDAARLGRFGRVLRASAMDELPQLVNVLRGEMSLVGPRPLLPDYLPRFTPAQRARLRARPGLCGLAQAAGRNAVPWGARLALDARYATARPTLPGDLLIIARCALVLLRGEGVSAPGHATMPAFPGPAGRAIAVRAGARKARRRTADCIHV